MKDPLAYAKRICYSSEETLMFSYEMAKKYASLPGFYVEAGVAAGAQVIAMATGAPNKTIFAFDSFKGIPLASNRDDQMPGIVMLSPAEQKALPDPGKQALVSSGATVVPIESFLEHLYNALGENHNVIPVEGWFEETVCTFDKRISILRLDGDLYHSTYVCLKYLFPKVINGGCVIIDDWTLPGCRAACEEYFNTIEYKPTYEFMSTIAYFFK